MGALLLKERTTVAKGEGRWRKEEEEEEEEEQIALLKATAVGRDAKAAGEARSSGRKVRGRAAARVRRGRVFMAMAEDRKKERGKQQSVSTALFSYSHFSAIDRRWAAKAVDCIT